MRLRRAARLPASEAEFTHARFTGSRAVTRREGVGAAIVTKEKAEAALNDLVKQGKISTADARAVAEKIAEQGQHEFEDLSNRLNEKIKEVTSHFDLKQRERIDAPEARVRTLEEKLAAASRDMPAS